MKANTRMRGKWITALFGLSLSGTVGAGVSHIGLTPVFENLSFKRPLLLIEAPLQASPGEILRATKSPRYWYVVEQAGRVIRLQQLENTLQRRVFVDLRKQVESGPNEAGLLGMALDPGFAENGHVYLSYTRRGDPLVSVLSRFVSRDGGRSLDTSSEQILLEVAQPYSNHNGGNIRFGPDGYLYYGLGDGGSAGDPEGNGQNIHTLLGALLRLDVHRKGAYGIPADNPFVKNEGRKEIFAYGLRNPWRWSFDRKNGDLWLADVGQNAWEEINIIRAGGNYGWNLREGRHCYSGDCRRPGLIEPVAEYGHDEGCSVTGGYVYRGELMPALRGVYVFADFCSGRVWGLFKKGTAYARRLLLKTDLNIASFAEDRLGEIYVVDLGGKLFRLTAVMPE